MIHKPSGRGAVSLRHILSVLLKLIAAGAAGYGVAAATFIFRSSFMGGLHSLLYFTIQSNILLCIAAVLTLLGVKGSGRLYYVSAVSITLTFVVFCTMLAPMVDDAWTTVNVLTHLVAPIAAILDYLFFDSSACPEKKHVFQNAIPPICYLCFTVVTYVCGVEYTPGKCYPYPFLNYGGSAGVFGFSADTSDSLFLGSFYWVLILSAFVIGVAALYRSIHNRRMSR